MNDHCKDERGCHEIERAALIEHLEQSDVWTTNWKKVTAIDFRDDLIRWLRYHA